MSAEYKDQTTVRAEKLPYKRPTLTKFGSMSSITKAGSFARPWNGDGNAADNPFVSPF